MNSKQSAGHFHIRWSNGGKVDWERFEDHMEAETGARELVRTGESYTIAEFDDPCQDCMLLKSRQLRQHKEQPSRNRRIA